MKKRKRPMTAAAELVGMRWAKTTPEERSDIAAEMARGRWAAMSKDERSDEMKRRRKKGLRKKRALLR